MSKARSIDERRSMIRAMTFYEYQQYREFQSDDSSRISPEEELWRLRREIDAYEPAKEYNILTVYEVVSSMTYQCVRLMRACLDDVGIIVSRNSGVPHEVAAGFIFGRYTEGEAGEYYLTDTPMDTIWSAFHDNVDDIDQYIRSGNLDEAMGTIATATILSAYIADDYENSPQIQKAQLWFNIEQLQNHAYDNTMEGLSKLSRQKLDYQDMRRYVNELVDEGAIDQEDGHYTISIDDYYTNDVIGWNRERV